METDRNLEIELKYQVTAPGGGDRYLVAPELGAFRPDGPVRAVRVTDRYMDSAGWALARAGYAARLRTSNRRTLISIKGRGSGERGPQRREELEGPADPAALPSEWPPSRARELLLELCGDDPLTELLTLRQMRRVRRLRGDGESTAELSVDEVEVFAGERRIGSFDELEIELKGGPDEPLAALADVLQRDDGLRPLTNSKFERAVAILRDAMSDLPEQLRRRWEGAPTALLDGTRRVRRGGKRTALDPSAKSDASAAEAPTAEEATAAGETAEVGEEPPAPSPKAPKPGPRTIGVVADDSMAEAARKVFQLHFGKMQRREAGTREGSDTEDLHDMRVSVRRMRAAWRVFDDAFRHSRTRRLRRRLENLSDRLGTVRDLDVLIGNVESYRAGLDPEQRPGLDPLLDLWRKQRSDALGLLVEELDSNGYERFIKEMEDFLESGTNGASLPEPMAPHRVKDRAPSLVWGSYEAVRAYELVLPWADTETLHQLRIADKWLRYTLEFFGETMGREAPRLLARVVALQDFLGVLHDADVAVKLARDVLVARAGELTKLETEMIGAYLHSREREIARLRRSLGPVWRAVNGSPFRRALGRATAIP